jgi:hypothetical protein
MHKINIFLLMYTLANVREAVKTYTWWWLGKGRNMVIWKLYKNILSVGQGIILQYQESSFVLYYNTKNLPWGKGWPTHKADNLVWKCGSLDVSQPYGPSPVTGTALPNLTAIYEPIV